MSQSTEELVEKHYKDYLTHCDLIDSYFNNPCLDQKHVLNSQATNQGFWQLSLCLIGQSLTRHFFSFDLDPQKSNFSFSVCCQIRVVFSLVGYATIVRKSWR